MQTTMIKDLNGPWCGHASLYRITPPLEYDGRFVEFIVVSASTKPPGPPEVAVFEADADGVVHNIGDHLLKLRWTIDHLAALRALIPHQDVEDDA